MRKITFRLFFTLIATVGLLTSSAFADLGFKQIAAEKGAPAVGQAVLAAAQAVYANNTDPAVIQSQLVAILNEAADTGNEQAIRYAIVAVMMAGGAGNIDLSKSAINSSRVFTNYGALTATTVASTESLLNASGSSPAAGVANQQQAGGGDPMSYGGGSDRLFLLEIDPNNPFTWGSLIDGGDNDLKATPI